MFVDIMNAFEPVQFLMDSPLLGFFHCAWGCTGCCFGYYYCFG